MGTAIIAYDLKNVKSQDNAKVKEALIRKYSNTFTHYDTKNVLSYFPEWVRLRFPDTTVIVDQATAPAMEAIAEVVTLIKSVGAEPGAVFVAYIGEHALWNADKQLPKLN